MPETRDKITDVVFPICATDVVSAAEAKWRAFLGTGFLIGGEGYALTAGHVCISQNNLTGIFQYGNEFVGFRLEIISIHPKEDVALLRIEVDPREFWPSWLTIKANPQHSSCLYTQWGYPEDLLYDRGEIDNMGFGLSYPHLIYTEGYIRRRISYSLPGLKGSAFYEISTIAGSGCSGSPLLIKRPGDHWSCCGIYLGEIASTYRVNEERPGQGERTRDVVRERAIGLRADAIADWARQFVPKAVD